MHNDNWLPWAYQADKISAQDISPLSNISVHGDALFASGIFCERMDIILPTTCNDDVVSFVKDYVGNPDSATKNPTTSVMGIPIIDAVIRLLLLDWDYINRTRLKRNDWFFMEHVIALQEYLGLLGLNFYNTATDAGFNQTQILADNKSNKIVSSRHASFVGCLSNLRFSGNYCKRSRGSLHQLDDECVWNN